MHIAQFTTRLPVATAVVFLAVNLMPEITSPQLLVWTAYGDVGPAESEEFVTIPMEEAVSTVTGVRRVHSMTWKDIRRILCEYFFLYLRPINAKFLSTQNEQKSILCRPSQCFTALL